MSIKEEIPGKQYLVTVWGLRQPDGSRPRMVRRVHGGPRKAAEKERELIALRDEGRQLTGLSVAQYAKRFLAGKRRSGAEQRTIDHYERSFSKYLPDDLRAKRMTAVKTGELRAVFDALEHAGADGGALSGTTRNSIERDIKALFRQAWLDGVTGGDVSKSISKTPFDSEEPDFLSQKDGPAFLAAIEGTAVYLPALTMYCTGFRPAEMLGLRRQNLNLGPRPSISVTHSVHAQGGRAKLGKLKTKRSKRTIRIPKELADALGDHLAYLDELVERLGPHYSDTGLVFPSLRCSGEGMQAGRIWTPTAFSHAWVKARPKDWSHVTPYTMRHTFITQRLMEGVRLEVVSRLAGHSTSGFTAKHYSHVLGDELHEVVVSMPTTT